MRIVAVAAALALAASLTSAGATIVERAAVAAPAKQAASGPAKPGRANSARKRAQIVKPTWERCFAMSIERGFDHEQDEWVQSIKDCMEGKIPL